MGIAFLFPFLCQKKIKKPTVISGLTFILFGAALGLSTLNENRLESSAEEKADINKDGEVDIADFSVLLFNLIQ